MAFRSKRLRVQLPCGDRTVFEMDVMVDCPQGTLCPPTSFVCAQFSCSFGEDSRVGPGGVCSFRTCDIATVVPCPDGSQEPPVDPGAVLMDPQDLGALREHLEERLKEIDAAEQALRKRG
jgi:hypothetical protein